MPALLPTGELLGLLLEAADVDADGRAAHPGTMVQVACRPDPSSNCSCAGAGASTEPRIFAGVDAKGAIVITRP